MAVRDKWILQVPTSDREIQHSWISCIGKNQISLLPSAHSIFSSSRLYIFFIYKYQLFLLCFAESRMYSQLPSVLQGSCEVCGDAAHHHNHYGAICCYSCRYSMISLMNTLKYEEKKIWDFFVLPIKSQKKNNTIKNYISISYTAHLSFLFCSGVY